MKPIKYLLVLITIFLFSLTQTEAQEQSFYNEKWNKTEKYVEKGLTKSALQVVTDIFEQAKIDNNSEQLIKSLILKHKIERDSSYKLGTSEKTIENQCYELDSIAQTASFPDNALIYYLLADEYWNYYKKSRFSFIYRSDTANINNNMQTWTFEYLLYKVIESYTLSLSDTLGLQKIGITNYKAIINIGTKPINLRPTLYDFLAHEALDFFSNYKISHTKPTGNFKLNEESIFDDAESFILKKNYSSDSLSIQYRALGLIQGILKFRIKNNQQQDALIDIDLKRLRFAYAYSDNINKVELYLNALKKLENKYKTNPYSAEVSYEIAKTYYDISLKYKVFDTEAEEYTEYRKIAREFCNKVLEKFPETNAAGFCRKLKAKIEKHNLSLAMETVVEPNASFAVKVNYQNTNKIYVRIGKIQQSLFEKYSWKSERKAFEKIKKNSTTVYEFSHDLPGDIDFYKHSVEVVVKDLSIGFYVVFVSNNEEFSCDKAMSTYQAFIVSNISFVNQMPYNSSNYFSVLNRTTGQAMKGVKCQTWQEVHKGRRGIAAKKEGITGVTDKNGVFIAKRVIGRGRYNWYVDFSVGSDRLSTFILPDPYRRKLVNKTLLFTDRVIYRPGQTIYFKGIRINATGDTNTIVADYKTTVELYDANKQKVSELKVTSNEFGTFSGVFKIPRGLLNGEYTISCNDGSKTVLVEEYKRPKFEVTMLPFKGNYLLNDKVEMEGCALSFSGSPVSFAEVGYRVTCSPNRLIYEYQADKETTEIKTGELVTDNNGHFKINFKALPNLSIPKSEYSHFIYHIEVDVTDINGETQTTSIDINVGYSGLQVSLPISEFINKNDEIYKDKKTSQLKIECYDLNYQPVNVKGEIKIYKLKDLRTPLRSRLWERPDKYLYTKEEWNKIFPGNVFENEDIEVVKEREVFFNAFDTKLENKFDFSCVKNFETGSYVAEIVVVDTFGNKVSNKHFFKVYTNVGNKMPYNEIALFIPVNNTCKPGEYAKFIVGSSKQNINLIYQIEHKNKIVSTEYIELNNEQKLISIPVEDKYQGNFSVHFTFVKNNRLYNYNSVVYVPYTNKKLALEFETFRNKLYPGEKEQWRIKIKDSKDAKVAAEMLATLYDASLDRIKENFWNFSIYKSYNTKRVRGIYCFFTANSYLLQYNLNKSYYGAVSLKYPSFNRFDSEYHYKNKYHFRWSLWDWLPSFGPKLRKMAPPKVKKPISTVAFGNSNLNTTRSIGILTDETENADLPALADIGTLNNTDFTEVKTRTNFNETAFFYPHLRTNEQGEVIVEFTVPESLTKWKMMGLATTKDLKFGSITNELITHKDLMLLPNEPRFLRENDKITFPVKISNVSEKDLAGKVKLELFDAISMKPISNIFAKGETETKDFEVKAGKNGLASWKLEIPEGVGVIMYKVMAKAGDFSDGEQKPLPVLKNRILVTEAMPLQVKGKESKTYRFKKLIKSGASNTLRHHKLTLEFTSNPAWYAIQALPYLMEYPYECNEQVFSRFYANSIALHIANSSPQIKQVFDSWKNTPKSEALLSNLEKNQELKAVTLEETPWVLDGKNEQENKRHLGVLFDLNHMVDELDNTLRKIQNAQKSNGAWPWFEGMSDSRYVTQHIVAGIGHLDKLGVKTVRNNKKTWTMLKDAVDYIDIKIREEYDWLKNHSTKNTQEAGHLSYEIVHYLYARSYFTDIKIPARSKKAFNYFIRLAEKHWISKSKYMQGMIALALHRYKNKDIPSNIVKLLKENSTSHEEMGMYWKDNVSGYYWYQAPIETQALMIEAFDEVTNDQQAVNDMKVWLLKQKQTQDWKTTKATTEAVYALLLHGSDWLASDKLVEIKMGDKIIDPKKMDDVKVEAGTGYFKTSWGRGEIKPEKGNVTVTKSDEGVSWGAVYWQYFEQLDKITPHETPLKLKKQLFIEKLTELGQVIEPISDKNQLKIGDKIIVRIELRVDRRMEYIHMKDMRASGFEPINVISTCKWQDNLSYYESTKDAATNFFMEALPKGTYVFEYPLRVTHKGDFSNGVTTIQCMYAPEFTSHSEGIRVKVKK